MPPDFAEAEPDSIGLYLFLIGAATWTVFLAYLTVGVAESLGLGAATEAWISVCAMASAFWREGTTVNSLTSLSAAAWSRRAISCRHSSRIFCIHPLTSPLSFSFRALAFASSNVSSDASASLRDESFTAGCACGLVGSLLVLFAMISMFLSFSQKDSRLNRLRSQGWGSMESAADWTVEDCVEEPHLAQ